MRKLARVAVGTTLAMLLSSVWARAYENEVKTISGALADQIAQAGKKSIAVVDFTDLQGNVTELGRFLAEEFSVRLAGAGKGFEVIDRNNLKTILQEHKLQASGIVDPATAKKLGQIAGVDALVTGSLTPFGDSVHVAVKVLDTSTARIIATTSVDIPKTKAVEELLGRNLLSAAPAASPTATRDAGRGAAPKVALDVSAQIDNAVAAYRRGELRKAAELFAAASDSETDSKRRADIRVKLAWTYFGMGNRAKAEEALKAALADNPQIELVPEYYTPDFLTLFSRVKAR